MKKTTILLALLFIISVPVLAQQATLKGTVIDTSEKKNLANTVIALLRPADSVLVSYTRSNTAGQFELQKLPAGKFIVMVTRPAYADYFDQVEVTAGATVDLGKISLILKSQLLAEVVVQHKLGAIRIKGDTTEYIADSFKLSAGATVEDLLKILPGIQVDKDGKITAQGEKVQKVLVDGEEFFSDDPTIVTRGFTADAVEKVQAFDKKSDQATFTGIDDGQKTKTLNVQLKEDRKKGYFGKLELGSDANKYWNNNLMINAFKGKRKFAAYGIMSNTGKTGLNWNEGMNYGANNNVEVGSDDGGISISVSGGDEFGGSNYWGEGLPKGWNGGLHYSNKWNGDKIHLNGNYQYNKLNTESEGNTYSQNILKDTVLYTNENGNSFTSRYRNRLDGLYEVQIDSFSSIKITVQGSKGESFSQSTFHQESLNSLGDTLSRIERKTTTDADNKNFNSTLLFKQKFRKQGRTLSISAKQNYTNIVSNGFFFSDNNYYENGILDSAKILDQQKLTENTLSTINSKVSYTEPINKRSLLEFNYSIDNNHRKAYITTMEKDALGGKEYLNRIDSLSNEYQLNVLTQSGGINYRYAKPKKINFSFGMNISNAAYTRTDIKRDSAINYSFTNYYPQANLNWTMGTNGNLRFNYNGSTQAPSLSQIQPIRDITNQMNIQEGNPYLKQAFRHRFEVSYNSFKFLSERSIYSELNYSTTQNDFSTYNFLDLKTGRKISRPINVDGNYRVSGYLSYRKKVAKWGLMAGTNAEFNLNHNTNFTNDQENKNDRQTFSIGPNIGYRKEKKVDIWLFFDFDYNVSKTSLATDKVTRYLTQGHSVWVWLALPWKLETNTDCTFNLRQKTSVFENNNNSIIWNGSIDKKFLKNDAGRLRFAVKDILNQNIGFNRNINNNFISERTYNTIKRNFMLSFIWNFNKNGKPMGF
ncbi:MULTISPECIES: TonB-dependent receptor [Niastella]|uniref:TonB-dependent receptor n=1 Tax=Niastella soli TaxID=2821487 RepID=A0ABS3YW33_9BACT|nr:TonB-dependent receptor [Niastella soli]MBO9201732.1 TonB-dependent receptor [Niastella soli]